MFKEIASLRTTLCLIISLLLAPLASAQKVWETFDDGLPEGWSAVVNSGTCDWSNGADMPTGPDFESPAMYFNDDSCGDGAAASNVSLYSKTYNLSSFPDEVGISFQVAFQEVASGETFVAEVNIDGIWQTLITYDSDLAEIVSEVFDIGVVNENFQMRWTYDDGGGAWGWHGGIDNFESVLLLSANDYKLPEITVSPNPASDFINISSASKIQNITLFNTLGQKVLEVTPNGLSQEIKVAALKAGVYIVNVVSDEQQGSYRLIKQ